MNNLIEENKELEIRKIYDILNEKINEKLTDEIVIPAAKGAHYLSDFMDDLPHNAYINKGATGCGGTTLAITNSEPYVIAVHSVNTIKNKINQHKNLCPVYNEISDDDIKFYIEKKNNNVQKFIVTYDSLPRLLKFINPYNFRLLVDEVQVLIRYLGHFKISTSNKLLNQVYKFKSTSYLTATPTERCYLPQSLKKLDYINIEWPNLIKPDIKHMYCGKQLQTKVVSFIIDKLDNTDDEIYVFYNSKSGVTSTIKKLLSAKPDMKLDDIKIVFSDSDENIKYFKTQLKCKNINIGNDLITDDDGVPLSGYNKRVNFISSFGFEGVDFYSFGKNVITLIVADSFSKSMRYDISIDLPQIIGRFRRDKNTNLFPKNDIFFIWKSMAEEVKYTDHDKLIMYISKNIYFCDSILKLSSSIFDQSELYESNQRTVSGWEPYIIRDTIHSEDYLINDYAMEGIMSAYCAMHVDYHMMYNLDENSMITDSSLVSNSLQAISNKLDTFDIPQLNAQYSALLNRKISFAKIAKEYYDLSILLKLPEYSHKINDIKLEMQSLLEMSDLLKDCLEYFTIEHIKGYNFKECHITKFYNNKLGMEKLKQEFSNYFKIGDLVNQDVAIITLAKLYNEFNINENVKKSTLLNLGVAKSKKVNGELYYEIINYPN